MVQLRHYHAELSVSLRMLDSPSQDVCAVRGEDTVTCYVAMAGCHQIWIYRPPTDSSESGEFCHFAGSGREENRNNLYPDKAGFAQPSGLALCESRNCLVVADSESSSIRTVDLRTGAVKALVGGALDPQDLFAFGDCDGKGRNARLQHPLGVACQGEQVYICDSYNHKIRRVSLGDQICSTLWAKDLEEPSGLCLSGNCLYIADTNHHRVQILELETLAMSTLLIKLETHDQTDGPLTQLPAVSVAQGGKLNLRLLFNNTKKLSTEAPNSLTVTCGEVNIKKKFSPKDLPLMVELAPKCPSISATCRVYLCDGGICTSQIFNFHVPLFFSPSLPRSQKVVVDLPVNIL